MLCRENVLNGLCFGWSWVVLEEYITTFLTIVTGVTLIWMNIERALRARHNRKENEDD